MLKREITLAAGVVGVGAATIGAVEPPPPPATVTVKVPVAVIVPKLAVIVAVPAETAAPVPLAPIVATAVLEDIKV